jgi:proline iminopeptidase
LTRALVKKYVRGNKQPSEPAMPPLLLVALVLLVACAPAAAPSDRAAREGYAPGADPDVRLYYRTLGSGPDTVLVLHGGPGGDLGNVAPDLEPLAVGRAIVAYDQRGGGRSTAGLSPERLGADRHVADLEALRVHLGLDRLTLVGHSWGAGLAALYALAHPGRVERMIFLGALPPAFDPFMLDFRANVAERLPEADAARLAAAREGWAADPVAACVRFWEVMMPLYTAGGTPRADMCGAPADALRHFFDVGAAGLGGLGEWDWRDDLRALGVPVLVVHGAHDPIPLAAAQAWVEAIPGARLHVVEDAAHFPHGERPDEVLPLIDDFLRAS